MDNNDDYDDEDDDDENDDDDNDDNDDNDDDDYDDNDEKDDNDDDDVFFRILMSEGSPLYRSRASYLALETITSQPAFVQVVELYITLLK